MKYSFSFILSLFVFIAHSQNSEKALANEYYSQNQLEKAISIYEKLVKIDSNLFLIHANYFDAMVRSKEYKKCDKYLKRAIKRFPKNPVLNVDYGTLAMLKGDTLKALQRYDDYLYTVRNKGNLLKEAASKFIALGLYDRAEKAYRYGGFDNAFDFDIADLFLTWGKIDKMVEQYLFIVSKDEQKMPEVQGLIQESLSDSEDFDKLEPILFSQIRQYPNRLYLNEMLIWYLLQKQEFNAAFIQAKAIDKRKKQKGRKIFEIGSLALNNKKYKSAIKIFKYLTVHYSSSGIYQRARKYLIKTKEEDVKSTFPIVKDDILSLVKDYEQFINEKGINRITADAVRSLALLKAFYLDEKDTAVVILDSLIKNRSIYRTLISKAKIDLADIYLLKGEPWEATLLYSQVEKTEKEKNLGHIAKLKNAKLNYYKGDFELAKGHLDVLKLATTREIANDAMALSLKIQDNLELDTTEQTMQEYAKIDLLIFQNKYDDALHEYDRMLQKYPKHSLIDDILWDKANLLLKLGKYRAAVASLEKIATTYKEDIWADDAVFMMGIIYEEKLQELDKAKEYFQKQLIEYKGSIHNVEARKHFRKLRGDKIN